LPGNRHAQGEDCDAVLAERIAHERELREAEKAAFDHERELRTLFDTHERELRLQNETAVEKARALQFQNYEQRLEAMNEFRAAMADQLVAFRDQTQKNAASYLPIERFDREHRALIDRYEREHSDLAEKVHEQESVTIRQDTQQDILAASQQNHKWLIGISIGIIGVALSSGLALVALLLHLAKVY